jgi:myo-inositol 2-dehydrogenase/D-chiro-inositol 1-dehydrogenase
MFRLRYVLTFLRRVIFLLRVGVIGLGHMGQLHLQNALRIDGIDVIATADKSKRNRKYAEKYHVKTYDDYSKLIDTEELDAVIISLPNFLKKESVFYAAENKLDIFLDKPLSRNFAEGQEIVQKAKKENVRLMVGANYRYFPCVEKLKNNLDDGKIGDAVIASSELVLNGPISHSVVPTPVSEWWLNKEMAGGGALLDLGYHLIDLLSWMLGDLKVTYSSLGYKLNLPIEDTAIIVLKSKDDNVTCTVNVGWFSKSIFPDFNFRINIHGTAGFDSTDRYSPGNPRVYAAKAGMLNVLRKILHRKLHYLSYTYYYSSFYTILDLFFQAVKNGTELPISLEKQLDVIEIVDSVYKQHEVT